MSQFPIIKVRKKPVVEDAILFDGTTECATRIIDWVLKSPHSSAHFRCDEADGVQSCGGAHSLRVLTLYGWCTVSEGWTVVQKEDGRFVLVDPVAFGSDHDIIEGAE